MRAGGLQTAFMYPSFCGSLCLYTRASSSSGSPCVLRRRRAGGLLTLTSSSRYTFSLFGAVLCLDLLRPPAIRSTPCTHRACTRSSACCDRRRGGGGLVPEQRRRAERRRRRPPNSARTSRPRTRTAGTEPRLHCGCKASERVVCACVGRVAGWGGAPSWHRRYQAGDDEGHQAHDAEAATIERTLGNDKKVQLLAGAIPPSSAPLGVRSSGSKLSSMQSRRARNQRSQKQARCVLPTRATQPPRHFATAVAAAIPPTTAAHPPCSLHSPAATPLSGGWRLRLWSRSRVRYFHCRAKFQFVSGCNEGTRLSMHETLRGVMRATSCPGNWG
jgi:hypothetical protein